MSLYEMTKEEIFSFLDSNYVLSENTKEKLRNDFIDGEVLFEFDVKDFEFFEFKRFVTNSIEYHISIEKYLKKKINEPQKEALKKKLKKFGIDVPDKLLNSDNNNMNYKIGQKKLLNKYKKLQNSKFNILKYLEEKIGLSEKSLKEWDGITKDYLFKMKEDEINHLNIDDNDKKN